MSPYGVSPYGDVGAASSRDNRAKMALPRSVQRNVPVCGQIRAMRQIILDTETTGLSIEQGHRIIEIGCIELVNRRITGREYHRFLNPERDIDEGAERVHGISREDLHTQPRFADIVEEFLKFVSGAELIIHNAEFDIGFLNSELKLMQHPEPSMDAYATVLDTLALARRLHPGQRNSLDALCKRYEVDASRRDVHGALIDAELLARVYLAMTGGQAALSLDQDSEDGAENGVATIARESRGDLDLVVIRPSDEELAAHEAFLRKLRAAGGCIWDNSAD